MADADKNTQPDDESLNWLAFRYVSGEMTDSELVDFEARLAPDSESFSLAACQAVAEAVQLGDVVVAAFDSASASETEPLADLPESRKKSPRRESFARRASIAASVVAAGWMLSGSSPEPALDVVNREDPSITNDDSDAASEMVRFWADADSEVVPGAEEHQLLTAADVPGTLTADVPDWLLAAVQSQQSASDALSEPEVLEN